MQRKKETRFWNVKDLERLLLLEVAPKVTKAFWLEVIDSEEVESLKQVFIDRLDRAKLIHESGISFINRALKLAEQKNIIKPSRKG
jgi:hypothetical protein